MRRTQYRIGLGGLLEHYPPARPSSATVAAFIAGSTPLFASAAVLLDPASEVIANVAATATTIVVADSSDFVVGRRYIARTDGGRTREVVVIDRGDEWIELEQPIGFPIQSGVVEGHGLRRMLSPAEASTLRRRVRIEWSYTVGGMDHVDVQLIDVVPQPFRLGLSEEHLEQIDPAFGDRAGASGAWRKLLAAAEAEVFDRIAALGAEPDLCYERDQLRTAAAYRALQMVHVGDQDVAAGETPFARYGRLFELAMARYAAGRFWYDRDADQVASGGSPGGGGDNGELVGPTRGELDGADDGYLRVG